jgi:hypothetical protein
VDELFVSALAGKPRIIDLQDMVGDPREKIDVSKIGLTREGRKVTARLTTSSREQGELVVEFWFSAPESHSEAKLLKLAIDLANTKHRYGQGPQFIQAENMEFRLATTINALHGPSVQWNQLQLQDSV